MSGASPARAFQGACPTTKGGPAWLPEPSTKALGACAPYPPRCWPDSQSVLRAPRLCSAVWAAIAQDHRVGWGQVVEVWLLLVPCPQGAGTSAPHTAQGAYPSLLRPNPHQPCTGRPGRAAPGRQAPLALRGFYGPPQALVGPAQVQQDHQLAVCGTQQGGVQAGVMGHRGPEMQSSPPEARASATRPFLGPAGHGHSGMSVVSGAPHPAQPPCATGPQQGHPRGGGCLTPSMPHHPGSLRHEAMSESPWPPATTDIGAGVQDASPGGVQAAPLPTGAWPAGLWCPSSYSQMGLGVPSSTSAPQGP